MVRRTFILKASLLSSIAVIGGMGDLLAAENKSNKSLDLSNILDNGKSFKLNLTIKCASTQTLILALVHIKKEGQDERTITSELSNMDNLVIKDKIGLHEAKKINIKVESVGFKTFEGIIYVNSQGCSIHTDIWKYNPKFKAENIPSNKVLNNTVISSFVLELIKL